LEWSRRWWMRRGRRWWCTGRGGDAGAAKGGAGAVEMFAEGEKLADAPREGLPSPGVGLRHYAPRARLVLVDAGAMKTRSI